MTQSTQPTPSSPSSGPVHPVLAAIGAMRTAVSSVAEVNPSFMRTGDKAAALSGLAVVSTPVEELRMRILADAGDLGLEGAGALQHGLAVDGLDGGQVGVGAGTDVQGGSGGRQGL